MKAELANCDKCPLQERKLIAGKGPDKADIVLVGDYPGVYEVFQGEPFSGQAGTMLRKTLEYSGIKLDDCYRTTAMLCNPPEKYKFKQAEFNCCRDRLIAEIKAREPKLVIIMGNTAVQAITGVKMPISSIRGQVIFLEDLGCNVLYSLHPAAVLRAPKNFTDFTADMGRIKEVVNIKPATETVIETKFQVVYKEMDAINWLQKLRNYSHIACDIETTGFNWMTCHFLCIALCWEAGKVIILPRNIIMSPIVRPYLRTLFEDKNIKFIWQNGKFDAKFFRHQLKIKARVDEDTMLKHYCLDERKGTHDLETTSVKYLGASNYKSKFQAKFKFEDGLSFTEEQNAALYFYCAQDTDYTFRLCFVFDPLLDAEGNSRMTYEKILIPASETLLKIEMRGMLVDKVYLAKLKTEFEAEIEKLLSRLSAIVYESGWDGEEYAKTMGAKTIPDKFNLASPKQLSFAVIHLLGLPKYKKSYSTDKKAMKHWLHQLEAPAEKAYGDDIEGYQAALTEWKNANPVNEFIYSLTTYRKKSKIYSTYIMGVAKALYPDGRVHPTFLLHGTECVSGDTLIWTDIGMCYAEDLCSKDVNEQGFAPRRLGVLAQEGGQFTSHTYIGAQRQTMHVKLGYGLTIRCTPEHPVMTDSGWIKAEDLANGDYVKTSFGKRFFPIRPVECTSAARFMGMFLADGFTVYNEHDGRYFIAIANSDSVVHEIVAQHARQQYGLNANFDHSNGCIKIPNKRLVQEWRNIFPHNGAANKKIPPELLHFSYAEWCAFIEGCSLDSSWCLSSSGKNKPKKALIRFNSLDKQRLVVIQQALWNMGVLSSLVEVEYNTKNNVRRTGDAVVEKQYQLNITGQQTLKYLQHMRCVTTRQHDMAQAFKQITYTRQGFKNCKVIQDELYVKVMDVKESGLTETVYDFTVPEVHNFTANGLIVHNTGRLACKEPNMQNPPRGPLIKNLFIVEEGWILLQADYSQAELRVLAVESGDETLRRVYFEDRDLHDEVATELFGPNFTKEERVRVKAVNFGVPYGRSEYTIAEEYGISLRDAREVIRKWFAQLPGAGKYVLEMRAYPKTHGGRTVETKFGRKRRFPLITYENANSVENEAINFPISSTASDCTLLSCIELDRDEQIDEKYSAFMVNEVHDSIVVEVPIENAYEVACILRSVMCAVPPRELNTDVPFKADVDTGYKYGSVKKADMEALRIMSENAKRAKQGVAVSG